MLEEIRMVRLLSGEEVFGIIGSAKDSDGKKLSLDEEIAIHKPMVLQVAPQENQKDPERVNMAFIPWLPMCVDQVFNIPRRNILVIGIPLSEIVDHYKRVTSPIITPSDNIIAPKK